MRRWGARPRSPPRSQQRYTGGGAGTKKTASSEKRSHVDLHFVRAVGIRLGKTSTRMRGSSRAASSTDIGLRTAIAAARVGPYSTHRAVVESWEGIHAVSFVSRRCRTSASLRSVRGCRAGKISARRATPGRTAGRRWIVFRVRIRRVDADARLAARRSWSAARYGAWASCSRWTRLGGDRRRPTVGFDTDVVSAVVAGRRRNRTGRKADRTDRHRIRPRDGARCRRTPARAHERRTVMACGVWSMTVTPHA